MKDMKDFYDATQKLGIYRLYSPTWTQDFVRICEEELGGVQNNYICQTL